MLTRSHLQWGVTLVEALVGLGIIGALFVLGMPGFSDRMANSQIRTAAEAIQNGLQLARTEAVRRNTPVRFQLTSSLDNACALTPTGANWVVSRNDPTNACGNAASEVVAPFIIQTRARAEGSSRTVVSAGQATIVFNGLGRVIPVPAANINICIGIAAANAAACADPTGAERRLLVVVSTGGQTRVCDPALVNTDTQGGC